ncbi:ribonuclease T2 family protein [Conservatibacter flavescens]|uniref:Ribonuclease T n=1 Tax=Conservatibacter flavescens TaxID=28161 RepID=A0A2M8S1A9_9PAST|nr:ribonuclease T [Conservatibacter flavescens]PJG84942.1 ribonuclease T [Conservatibacter flavescens]
MNQKQISQLSLFVICVFMLLLAGWYYFSEQKHAVETAVEGNYDVSLKSDPIGQNKRAPTNYYTLVLSWSPAFCEKQRRRNNDQLPKAVEYQCGKTQQFGWVIHGLWPQNAKARRVSEHPRFCQGDLKALPQELIEQYMAESPSARLLQGQWEKHGACAFKEAKTYFDKQRELYHALKLPNYELSRKELFNWLKKNNSQLQGKNLNASRNELFICYDLDWAVIDCPRIR